MRVRTGPGRGNFRIFLRTTMCAAVDAPATLIFAVAEPVPNATGTCFSNSRGTSSSLSVSHITPERTEIVLLSCNRNSRDQFRERVMKKFLVACALAMAVLGGAAAISVIL